MRHQGHHHVRVRRRGLERRDRRRAAADERVEEAPRAALDGAPGVYSARFSGANATATSNNELLIEKLHGKPDTERNAWYTCNMALSDPNGSIAIQTEAYCHGRILSEPRGTAGFGYDPLFEIPEYHQTFAEMGNTVKSILSHRARAHRLFMRKLTHLLPNFIG